MESYHYRRYQALMAMNLTYRLWERWKDMKDPRTRRLALIAKTQGLIVYDHMMRKTI